MEASNFGGKQERCRQSTKHGFVRSKVILFIAPTEPRTRCWREREGERERVGGETDLREMATAFPV